MTEPLTCKSCGQPYEFVPTVTGRMMPIDLAPNAAGNIVIVDGTAEVLRKGDPRWDSIPATERRMSHFATCSAPDRHRKQR